MSGYVVTRYGCAQRDAWQSFVAGSRNGTFLFDRDFMEYHGNRFEDHSLMVRDAAGGLVGLLPANVDGTVLNSHGGLTYGGLVVGASPGSVQVLGMLAAVREALPGFGIECLAYKTVPWIYHRQPAEEDRYALFRLGARLVRRDVLSVVTPRDRLPFQERRARGIRGAAKAGVVVAETTDFGSFWSVLEENLRQRHGVGPVHSLAEIEMLAARFPRNIRLFIASLDAAVIAGVAMFVTDRVAHVQYISANDTGRRNHALDLLFATLLDREFAAVPYFDFGISNEQQGRILNEGLVAQKEGFGARTVVHDYYELDAS